MPLNINIEKAKDIHRDKIRKARKPLLESLDLDFMLAQETSSDTTTIVADKQALRDAPAATAIDDATTTDDLKTQWDTGLLGTSPYAE